MKPQYATSITFFVNNTDRNFSVGETMSSWKIIAIEITENIVLLVCDKGTVMYNGIPFIAMLKK
mgnify:FL=1